MLPTDYKPGPAERRALEAGQGSPPVEGEVPARSLDLPVLAPARLDGLLAAARALVARKTTRGQFAAHLLRHIGDPRMSENRLLALLAWMQAEGDAGRWNPLNATWRMAGSTTFNWANVQNYTGFDQGVQATALTLNYGAKHELYGYRAIRHALYVGSNPRVTLEAVEESAWGTGGLALRVYEETKDAVLLTSRHHRLAGA